MPLAPIIFDSYIYFNFFNFDDNLEITLSNFRGFELLINPFDGLVDPTKTMSLYLNNSELIFYYSNQIVDGRMCNANYFSQNFKPLLSSFNKIVLKLNEYLIFNSTNQFIDYSQIMCPNSTSLTNDSFDSYYSFFLNMKQVNSYIGLTSFGIRELNQTEKMNYCKINQTLMNNSFQNLPITNELIFTDNFQLR